MRATLLVLLGLLAFAAAAPTVVVLEEVVEEKPEPIPILKHINQVNDDGSYTFGYESGDGSFRVETRTIDGRVLGKFGYIDEYGERQVIEYVTGKDAGKSLGYQPRGSLVPIPVIRPVASPEQRELDYQYSSVDEDEDGIPDYYPPTKAAYPAAKVAYAEPAKKVYADDYAAPAKAYAEPAKKVYVDDYAAPAKAYADDYVEPVKVVVPEPEPVRIVPVVPPPVPIVPVVPAPAPVVRVVQPAPLPVPVVSAPPLVPQPVRVVAPAPLPVPVVSAPPLLPQPFQVVQQVAVARQPVAIANPSEQFLSDLSNQSVDANEDGEPDVLVGEIPAQVPVAAAPFTAFGGRFI